MWNPRAQPSCRLGESGTSTVRNTSEGSLLKENPLRVKQGRNKILTMRASAPLRASLPSRQHTNCVCPHPKYSTGRVERTAWMLSPCPNASFDWTIMELISRQTTLNKAHKQIATSDVRFLNKSFFWASSQEVTGWAGSHKIELIRTLVPGWWRTAEVSRTTQKELIEPV